jgi:hemolysin activation/secretion protein
MSNHARRKSQAKAEQAQAELAEAEKVAKEQAAAIARAVYEDEAHRQADVHEVAVREAEAVPDWPPGP